MANVVIVLEDAGRRKIEVIKVIREISGLGLKESKEATDRPPTRIKEFADRVEAEQALARLREAGARAVVVDADAPAALAASKAGPTPRPERRTAPPSLQPQGSSFFPLAVLVLLLVALYAWWRGF